MFRDALLFSFLVKCFPLSSLALAAAIILAACGGRGEMSRGNLSCEAEFFAIEATLDDVARCLSEGSDPNALLRSAAEANNLTVLKVLLDAGADPNARNENGETPLHEAVTRGNWGVVKLPGERLPRGWWSSGGNLEVVKLLLDAGADLNARDPDGATPLHLAAYEDNPEAMKVLLNAGVAPNTRDKHGATPLHWAVRFSENPEVVKVLLNSGANPNARNDDGWAPLHRAAEYNGNPEVLKVLLNAGANPNTKTIDGQTPFEIIPEDSLLKGTDVYWQLNDAR
ncbi:MAG: ankyrin repeat domain-containing protein [Cyanobacteria bacterium MAG CAR3_bin_5]|nr:ankyrin repeat domain-containing protein [Cyanobacteria bacterium MAG CAR3_bin_5]